MSFLKRIFVFDDNEERNKSVENLAKNSNLAENVHPQTEMSQLSSDIQNKVKSALEKGEDVMVIMNAIAAFERDGLKDLSKAEQEALNKARKLIFSCQSGTKNNKAAKNAGVDPASFRSIKSTGRTALDKLLRTIRGWL